MREWAQPQAWSGWSSLVMIGANGYEVSNQANSPVGGGRLMAPFAMGGPALHAVQVL